MPKLTGQFSDYIIYVDESGDHNLERTDPDYPLFVLAFCIIKKQDYWETVSPAIQRLKFEVFGHDLVVLHENEIRKSKPPFDILLNERTRTTFFTGLNSLMETSPYTVVASVIRKDQLTSQYTDPSNPYELALLFCLERTYGFLKSKGQHEKTTHIVVECRGEKEDNALELEFLRICKGNNWHRTPYPFEIVLADKKRNSGGLQLADLMARPIGLSILRPSQPNRAYEIIKNKFYQAENGCAQGYGLKIFP
jgi:hypothetical protein